MKTKITEYPIIGRKYKHYKGGTYEIITLANHSEDGTPLVIYKSISFGSIYARPLDMFFDVVGNIRDKNIKRFEIITDLVGF